MLLLSNAKSNLQDIKIESMTSPPSIVWQTRADRSVFFISCGHVEEFLQTREVVVGWIEQIPLKNEGSALPVRDNDIEVYGSAPQGSKRRAQNEASNLHKSVSTIIFHVGGQKLDLSFLLTICVGVYRYWLAWVKDVWTQIAILKSIFSCLLLLK